MTDGRDIDGVGLAVLHNRLQGIAHKMQNTLFRTGRSGVLNTGHDFSCCIVTAACELIAAAESLPIHVMVGPDMMARSMLEAHPTLRRGDAFLHNSPYHGNSHPADHTILVPVIDEAGMHRFTVVVKAHQADCGNSRPTTYMASARDVYEEGALIFPAVRVQQDYRDCTDIIRLCRMRIRVPQQWWGDYLAMVGAARIGERALLALGAEVGWQRLDMFVRAWFDYSERRMIAALRRLPGGEATARTVHDPFPGAPEGIPVQATVRVDNDAALVEVNLRDNPDCLPCGLNLSEACARTAALIGVFNALNDNPPPNAGSFRRVRVLLREGCVVGIPRHPTSCSVATTNLADRVANTVQRAIAELGEGVGMADAALLIPPSDGVISGRDPRAGGAPFVNQVIRGLAGGPGGPAGDGWLTFGHPGSAGLCRWDSVEMDELLHPILIREVRLLTDSEGAGRHRGAPGTRVEFGPVGCDLELLYASDGNRNPPQGVRGGAPGGASAQFRRALDGTLTPADSCGPVTLRDGEAIVSISCGGGGYGPPLERDPGLVARDVAEGWISRERAEQVYGVVLAADGRPEVEATARRRATVAAVRSP